jgi:membrane protein implicated in regulation of membrane protease activity
MVIGIGFVLLVCGAVLSAVPTPWQFLVFLAMVAMPFLLTWLYKRRAWLHERLLVAERACSTGRQKWPRPPRIS